MELRFHVRCFLISILFWGSSALGADPLSGRADFKPQVAKPGEIVELHFDLDLEEDYKAFVDQFKVKISSPTGVKAGQIEVANSFIFADPFTKTEREAVKDDIEIRALIETPEDLSPGSYDFKVALTFQACTVKFCLLPKDLQFVIPLTIDGLSAGQEAVPSAPRRTPPLKVLGFEVDLHEKLWLSFAFVFLAGVLTSFTPCIFPMIPITIAILGRGSQFRSRLKTFSLSLVYVLGIALTYSTLGLVAASTGAMFGSAINHPAVLLIISLLFIAMAVSLYGGFELQAPAWIRNQLGAQDTGHGYKGALLAGLIAGIVASPCVGPVLVGILAFVASTGNLWLGFLLLFTFALGLGQLFLFLGLSSDLGRFLPRSGPWMEGVKFFFGSVMLAVAFYYLQFLLPDSWWWLGIGLSLIVVPSFFGAFAPVAQENSGLGRIKKGFLIALFLVGVGLTYQSAVRAFTEPSAETGKVKTEATNKAHDPFVPYSQEAFAQAVAEGQPIMIDFYADWCVACKELEIKSFTKKIFKEKTKDMALFRFDATESSPLLDELSQKYGVYGLPTVLIFDNKGELREDLTITGFETAEEIVQRLDQL